MELVLKDSLRLDDGLHAGVITRIEYRTTISSYQYADVVISLSQDGQEVRANYPCKELTKETALWQLLVRFGAVEKIGEVFDVDKVLVGKKCQFLSIRQKSKKDASKSYAKIIPESLKPL